MLFLLLIVSMSVLRAGRWVCSVALAALRFFSISLMYWWMGVGTGEVPVVLGEVVLIGVMIGWVWGVGVWVEGKLYVLSTFNYLLLIDDYC